MEILLSAPGVLCCAGNGRTDFFNALLNGDKSGIRPVTTSGGRPFLVGRIRDEALGPAEAHGSSGPGVYAAGTRIIRIIGAVLEQIRGEVETAIRNYGPGRVGVCMGVCDNGSEGSLTAHRAYFDGGAFPADYDLRFQGAAFPAEFVSRRLGVSGPVVTVSTACASGAGAVIKGAQLISAGLCDAVIAGGADVVSETVLLGFASLEAVSDGVCNPFSKNRKGITLGEGAAFFVMTKSGPGNGEPRVELRGYGESADAFHMTAPRSDGSGAARAMKEALSRARLDPGEVDYINLHGTGTALNDRMEALALDAVFRKSLPPASSTKPITGHTLGAAGALELAVCWMTLYTAGSGPKAPVPPGLPPHCWDGVYDGEIPALRFAGPESSGENVKVCMSNSFAFGGCNTSLILARVN
ncbi:MAG: 3-oxoacyl-ACP synthase [Treponema sp.]|jgi:3-oxoacyl-[acyl-carrier-protein] synthase-1|nr:3-oxoacyl-ACP synthase [Treponema sp.]